MDIVDAGNQANEALEELDGSHAGLSRTHVKIRNFIFDAYKLGKKDFDKEIENDQVSIRTNNTR